MTTPKVVTIPAIFSDPLMLLIQKAVEQDNQVNHHALGHECPRCEDRAHEGEQVSLLEVAED